MPEFITIRKGVTPSIPPVPTDTTLIVMPMTLHEVEEKGGTHWKVRKELEDEDEDPTRIDSVNDALKQFKPGIAFRTQVQVGEDVTEFAANLEFRSLKDFSPENIQKRTAGQCNDIADLKTTIDLLYRLKDRWALPAVKRAWNNPAERQQILAALAKLRVELEKVAHVEGVA